MMISIIAAPENTMPVAPSVAVTVRFVTPTFRALRVQETVAFCPGLTNFVTGSWR